MSAFLLIRFTCSLFIALIVLMVLRRRFKWIDRKMVLMVTLSFILIFGILSQLIVENLFMSFQSPEEANNYKVNKTIDNVIESNGIALVRSFSSNINQQEIAAYYYSKGSWKIPGLLFAYQISTKTELREECYIKIYKINGLNKMLVTIQEDFLDEPVSGLVIKDNYGSKFNQNIEFIENMEMFEIIQYVTIEGDLPKYELNINGELIF